MKKFLSVLLFVLFVCTALTLTVSAGTYDNLYYEIVDGEVTITGTSEYYSGYYVIPDKIEGYPVTEIDDYAFYYTEYGSTDAAYSSVVIPNTVTMIGEYAFYGRDCSGVIIPESVKSIGDYAFGYYRYDDFWYDPESDMQYGYYDEYAQINSFYVEGTKGSSAEEYANYHGIEFVELESELEFEYTISNGEATITGCAEYLTFFEIPSEVEGCPVTAIGDAAFWSGGYYQNLIEVVIPNTVKSIGHEAFRECERLTSVTIANSVISIGWRAFCDCTSLTEITIPDSVISIAHYVFDGCDNLVIKGVKGSTAETYSDENGIVFEDISVLSYEIVNGEVTITRLNNLAKKLIIPATIEGYPVTKISKYILDGNNIITSVIIPDSVASIDEYAFTNNKSLKEILVDNNNPEFSNDENGILYNKNKTTLLRCPANTILTEFTIPDSVTSIGFSAFMNCDFTSVTIPKSVITIAGSAFSGCNNLTEVTIPDSVTTIDTWAFAGCTNLDTIIIPDSVISISSSAFDNTSFYNNSSNWENDVLYIDNHLIKAKDTISGDYEMKSGTKTIAKTAFFFCYYLDSVTIPDSVISIGQQAFYNCISLTSVTMGNGVTSIGNSAFRCCDSLTAITIPASVTSIGNRALGYYFSEINDLFIIYGYAGSTAETYANENDITFEEIVDISMLTYEIVDGEVTITDCDTSVTSVTIPSTIESYPVTKIGDEAFRDCLYIEELSIPNSVKSIGSNAFFNCISLKEFSVDENSPNFSTDENGVLYNKDKTALIYCADGTTLTEFIVSDSVTTIESGALSNCRKITQVSVDENNPNYSSDENGILYNKDKTTLVSYPAGKSFVEFTVPDSVTTIGNSAFYGCTALRYVIIPKSVTEIGIDAVPQSVIVYVIFPTVDGSYVSVPMEVVGPTIKGFIDSTAETYANENNVPFFPIGSIKETGISLYLDGGIGVKLHFEYDAELISPESLVFNAIFRNSKDYSVTQKEVSLTLDADGKSAYVIFYVPAKDINTVSISGTLMGETVSGTTAQLDRVSEITVPTYIEALEEKAETDSSYANVLDVVHAMETYCAYADAYFNNTEIEDITLTDAEESAISEIAHPSITDKTLGDIEFYSTSLLLEGTVTLRHYFKVTGDIDLTDYVVDGGSELTLSDGSVGYAYIDIENISANELGVQKTVKITNNGETTEIVFSPLNYVKLAYNDDDTALKNLVRALYRYGVKATEYTE